MTTLLPEPPGSGRAGPDPALAGLGTPYAAMLRDGLAQRWSDGGDGFAAMCHYALTPAGKMLRPALLVESCAAVEGDVSQVLSAALGTEAGHVASLVHDDIIDGDTTRRGRASVHHRFGTDNAIVVGDALLFDLFLGLAQCVAAGVSGDRVAEALRIVAEAGIELCRGQLLETRLCGRLDCGVDAYDAMASGKTGALFRGACEAGAVLGGGSPQQARALAGYGADLGLAFQIADDLLPFVSDTERAGKSASSDLRNRRPTLPVIYAWQGASPRVRRQLSGLYAQPDPATALLALHDIVTGTGGLERAVHRAQALTARAAQRLHALPDTASRARLVALARAVVRRQA